MRLYLPEPKERKSLLITVAVLIGITFIGICLKINDWTYGHAGRLLDRALDWLIERDRRRHRHDPM